MENQENQQENINEEAQKEEHENPEEIAQLQINNEEDQNENIANAPPSAETQQEIKPEDIDIETKKENFRKYLEEKGMMNILTKLLVELYERNDRPVGPEASFEYCSRFFSKLEGYDINVVNSEIEQNKEKLKDLEEKYDELDKELNGTDQQ